MSGRDRPASAMKHSERENAASSRFHLRQPLLRVLPHLRVRDTRRQVRIRDRHRRHHLHDLRADRLFTYSKLSRIRALPATPARDDTGEARPLAAGPDDGLRHGHTGGEPMTCPAFAVGAARRGPARKTSTSPVPRRPYAAGEAVQNHTEGDSIGALRDSIERAQSTLRNPI